MRTAFVTNFCPFYRVKLFRILAEKIGAKFLFFSDASEKNWEALNPSNAGELPVVPLMSPPAGRMRVLWRVLRALWTGGYDLFVQGISGRSYVLTTYLIARIRRKPIIIWTGLWNHPETLFHRLTFPLVRHIYRHADALVGYGTHVRDYLSSLGVDRERVFIARNTADNSLYNLPVSPEDAQELRDELNIGNRKVILFVGRLQPEKGVNILLEAVARLNKREQSAIENKDSKLETRNSKFATLIIGRGPEEETLKSYCEEHNLDNILFLNYVSNDELFKYYNLADIVVAPSVTTTTFKEPWGLVANEAMNQGCVVIASDAVGAARGGLLKHGENGLVVPEGNSDELTSALENVLCDDELRARLSRAARATIADWTYDKMAQGFIDAVTYVTTDK